MKKFKIISILLSMIMMVTVFASCTIPSDDETDEIDEATLLAQEEAWNAEQYRLKVEREMIGDALLLSGGESPYLTEATASIYLGHGYNIVKSHYYNADDVDTTMPRALDLKKLSQNDKLIHFAATGVEGSRYMGSTFSQYQSSVSENLSVEASYGLFTKVSADFNLSKDTNVSTLTNCVFITDMNYLRKEQQSAVVGTTPRDFATQDFLDIIDAPLPETDNERYDYFVNNLFETYGTHILTSIVLGGRYKMSFVYKNTQNKQESKIAEDLAVTYSAIKNEAKGTVSKVEKDTATEMISNSQFSVKTLGGPVNDIGNDYSSAVSSYSAWSQGIEDGHNLTFCDVNPKNGNVPMPVWEFAKNNETKIALMKAFTEYVESYGGLFKGIDDELGKISLPKYIEKIYIGTGSTPQRAKDDLAHQISLDYKEKTIDRVTAVTSSYDMKRGTGGDFVYLGYTTTYDKSKAITDIRIGVSLSEKNPKTYEGYTVINKDLNGSLNSRRYIRNGKLLLYPYVYVYYSKLASKGQPIENRGIQSGDTKSFGSVTKGWSCSCGFGSYEREMLDINMLTPSQYRIFIWVYSSATSTDD